MNYNLWNIFANIKNGLILKRRYIIQPKKKMYSDLLNILWNEGFILGYEDSKTNFNTFKVYLKYKEGKPVLTSLQFLSKPGHRIYCSLNQLWKLNSSKITLIFFTNKGFMTLDECKKLKIGGEPFIIIK